MNLLIIAFETGRWGPARLVGPLRAAGCQVAALCPPGNTLAAASALDRHFPLADIRSSARVAKALAAAMAEFPPNLVIPADERVVAMLHALVRAGGTGPLTQAQIAIITASLGNPQQFDAMLLKSDTLALARQLGIAVPAGGTVASADDAQRMAAEIGYPVYVKSSFSWGGAGVTLCANPAALDAAMAAGQAPAAHPLRQHLRRLLRRDWYPTGTAVDVQQAITGSPAMFCAVALRGRMLAGFAGRALTTRGANGPSSVVRIGPDAGMAEAAAKLIAAYGCSGFIGFDFMEEAATGRAFLLECNPRPIQVTHLGPRIGVDLCAALAAALRGEAPPPQAPTSEAEIALFPQEWLRDPASLAGASRFLDVPWEDPALLRAMVNTPAD